MHARRKWSGRALAGLAFTGVLLGGGVSPVLASEIRIAPSASIEPAPPSAEARSAALEVQEYVLASPRPTLPDVDAARATWNEPVAAMVAFYSGFPIEAGLAQWDCWMVGDSADVQFIPETEDSPAAYGYSYGFGCGDGYRPDHDEILSPRLDALDDAPVGESALVHDACQTIAGGQHCISFPGEVRADYFWLGSRMHGRTRLGQAGVVSPSCNSGSAVLTSSTRTLGQNEGIRLVYSHRQNANWSLTFDEANASGVIIGARSVACELGLPA